jgi:hypothetical protein
VTALQSETNLDSSCAWCVWATDETDPEVAMLSGVPEGCPPHDGTQHWLGCGPGQFREWVLGGDSEPAWEIVLGAAPDEDQQRELRRLLDDACALNARIGGPLSWTEAGGVVEACSCCPGGWVSLETAVRLAEAAGHEVVWMRRRRPSS